MLFQFHVRICQQEGTSKIISRDWNLMEYINYYCMLMMFWYSGYGGETDISLNCDRFYGPFLQPQMRMSEGVNE
jgi:hypothetical protein